MPSDDPSKTDGSDDPDESSAPTESDDETTDDATDTAERTAADADDGDPAPTDAESGAAEESETTEKIEADPGRDVFSSVQSSDDSADSADSDDEEAEEDEALDSAVSSSDEADESSDAAGEMVFCRECGERIAASAPTCPHCGAPQESASGSKTGKEKDPGIAALASLIVPGAGQLYNGQFVRGAIAFVGVGVVDLILVVVALVLSIILIGPLFLLLIPVVHILVAYDAYDQAGKINSGEVDPDA